MQRRAARERIGAEAESRAHRSFDRPAVGDHQHREALFQEARLDHREQVGALVGLLVQRADETIELIERRRIRRHERTALAARRFDGLRDLDQLIGLDASHARHALTDRFELDQLGLHLADLACHRVQVFAHEPIALRELVAHDELHDLAHQRPAFARGLEKNEVVDRSRQQRENRHQRERRAEQLPAADVEDSRARDAAVGDENLHR